MTVPVPPPPSAAPTRRRWVAVAAVAVLALVALAVVVTLGLRAGDTPGPVAGAPTPTATPHEPAATVTPGQEPSPGPGASPTAEPPGDGAAEPLPPLDGPRPDGVDEIVAQVSALRGLPADDELDVRVVPPGDLGSRLSELAFAEYDEAQILADERLLKGLRLLEAGDDLRAAIEDLYRAQVLGLYVVEEQVLYVAGEGAQLTAAQRITAAHEVLHALQDAAFDLDTFMDLDDRESDAAMARLALVEGDAMLTQELWSLQHQRPTERQDAIEEDRQRSPDALLRAPPYVRETLLFPYTAGARFVEALILDGGGFAAVDAAFADPPSSTRHVLRPDTYLAGETHTGTEVTTTPGDGWEEAAAYTFGEFDLDQWLEPLGTDRLAVADGWDGGETRLWQRDGDDAIALALRLRTPEAAAAACAAVPAWYAAVAGGEEAGDGLHRGDGDWMAVSCDELDVLVGLAPESEVAERLAGR